MPSKPKKAVKPSVVGEPIMRSLASVRPNPWNPQEMTAAMRASLKHGLETDGWLMSQALTIWGTDEKGVEQNIIIDGEHRWIEARELGFAQGPMLVLDGLTEVEAKKLTIKLNRKRGEFDRDKLADLVREIQYDLGDRPGLELGFPDEEIMKMMATDAVELTDGPGEAVDLPPSPLAPPRMVVSENTHVRMVPLFFSEADHARFSAQVEELSKKLDKPNVTETVLEAVRRAEA